MRDRNGAAPSGLGLELPTGSTSFELCLGPLRIRIERLPTTRRAFVERYYSPLAEEPGADADLVVRCREARGTVLPLPPPGGETRLQLLRESQSRFAIRSHWQDGWIDLLTGEAEIVFTSRLEIPFRMSLENFLRTACQLLLVERQAFLMHTAAVIDRAHAFLFFGPSGAGKSTATRNSAPRPALSDDMVLIDVAPLRPHAVAVPFLGTLAPDAALTGSWPIAAALRLRQSSDDRLEPLGLARAVATVSASVPFLHELGLPHEGLTRLVARFCSRVPAYDLHLTDGPGFWSLLGPLDEEGHPASGG
jgi:hypothetical protein